MTEETKQRGRTISEAISIAIEALSGDLYEWVILDAPTLRDHVTWWVDGYARARGVILDRDKDIAPVLDELVARVRVRIRELELTPPPVDVPVSPRPDTEGE